MSKLPLTLLPLLFVAIPTSAQDGPEKKIPWANKFFTGKADTPPPVILHDFGTLPQGTIKTYRFRMTNIYAFPVQVILPKYPSCRCVSVIEYTGKMNPRETGHIDIRIDTSRVEGPKTIDLPVRFECRDPKSGDTLWSIAQLEVRAVSRPDITITPGAIAFGTVPTGQQATKTVKIEYTGRQPKWAITDFEFKKELLDVSVAQLRGAVAYQVTATVKANAPTGRFDEQIVLKTNDPASPVLTLTVTGEVQAKLSIINGDQLKFNGVDVGKKEDRKINIVADEKFKIKTVEGQGDGITVPVPPLQANKVQTLTITFEPTKPGPVKKELIIRTDMGESVKLTVEGTGKEPPQ